MSNLSFSKKDDLNKFLKEEKFNKILVISGAKSFNSSGAKKFFEGILDNKTVEFYFKKFAVPNHIELKDIITLIKKFSPESKVMSMIKSDAYGHGILEVAHLLKESDAFAVATIEEATYLRNNNIDKEIVCLQGFSHSNEYKYCSENNIRPVIHDLSQLKIIENTTLDKNIKLWIKIDTGMNRLGFHSSDLQTVFQKCKIISNHVGIMTHLACANEDKDDFSNKQINVLQDVINEENIEHSIFNSADTIRYSK